MSVLAAAKWAVVILFLMQGVKGQCEIDSVPEMDECVQPPLECPNSNITYLLYTSKKPKVPQKLEEDNLENVRYVQGSPIKVLIHGYKADRNDAFNTAVRAAYMQRGDYNLLCVDYAPLAAYPCYDQGATNAQLIGVCLAHFLDALSEAWGIPLESLHVVGHGLGAQVAGLCANCLRNGRLGRITGLDPSKRKFADEDKNIKLDATDAVFVDVIHTNAASLGVSERTGDVDFYVNGGMDQPGCDRAPDPDWCSHSMAAVFFAESIFTNLGFWAGPCREACGRKLGLNQAPGTKQAVLMGEDVSVSAYGNLCVDTGWKPPYAKGRSHVKPHTLIYDVGGIIMVIICLYFSVQYFFSARH